jgi:uncharacterized membrane protein YbjE (DUF340 family)
MKMARLDKGAISSPAVERSCRLIVILVVVACARSQERHDQLGLPLRVGLVLTLPIPVITLGALCAAVFNHGRYAVVNRLKRKPGDHMVQADCQFG